MKREDELVIGADVGEGLAFSGTSPPESSDGRNTARQGAVVGRELPKPFCKRCSSHFCPHVKPSLWKNDPEGVRKWEAWLKEEGR